MGKTKKDTNARVAGRREQTKESAAEQMCMDNIPMDLNELDDSSVSNSTKESLLTSLLSLSSSQILHNLSLLLTRSFCPLDTSVASSARPTFASSLIDVFSFILRFFELVNGVFRGPCLLIT